MVLLLGWFGNWVFDWVGVMTDLLIGIRAGDLVEFDLVTNPIAVDRVERFDDLTITLSFKCHSGYWSLPYKWDGTRNECFTETGIHDAFDIVKVTRI